MEIEIEQCCRRGLIRDLLPVVSIEHAVAVLESVLIEKEKEIEKEKK